MHKVTHCPWIAAIDNTGSLLTLHNSDCLQLFKKENIRSSYKNGTAFMNLETDEGSSSGEVEDRLDKMPKSTFRKPKMEVCSELHIY